MPISHVYTLADLPARIVFVPVLYIILTRWTPLFRVQRSVLPTTSHIYLMILGVITPSSRFLSPAPYNSRELIYKLTLTSIVMPCLWQVKSIVEYTRGRQQCRCTCRRCTSEK